MKKEEMLFELVEMLRKNESTEYALGYIGSMFSRVLERGKVLTAAELKTRLNFVKDRYKAT
jgi:hypothetical protein